MLTLSAYAKINLTLEVIARREDGYHDISTILQTISLADEIFFEPSATFEFVCQDQKITRPDLLEKSALKAASLLRRGLDYCAGARITIKRSDVPRAAGLGGSSSLPATVLKGLNQLWNMDLSPEKLAQTAAMLGSDTPFFISGGTALAEGRGEKITPLPSPPKTWLVLVWPNFDPIPNKTALMYAQLDHRHFSGGTRTAELVDALTQQKPLLPNLLYNTFENIAFDFYPGLSKLREELKNAGAGDVHLAGAGPTLFAMVPDEKEGQAIKNNLKNTGIESQVAHTI